MGLISAVVGTILGGLMGSSGGGSSKQGPQIGKPESLKKYWITDRRRETLSKNTRKATTQKPSYNFEAATQAAVAALKSQDTINNRSYTTKIVKAITGRRFG